MPARCENCDSIFFKTLETRIDALDASLLTKKRCKRCKFKYLFCRDAYTGETRRITQDEWLQATPIENDGRARILVSEYSRRISQAACKTADYLDKLRQAGRIQHGSA